jgi:glutathione synthetase
MFRSDYMVHVDPSVKAARPQIRQVEFNTIASSFGGLSSQVSQMHKSGNPPLDQPETDPSRYLAANGAYPPNKVISASALPPNSATKGLAEGLATAHGAYGASRSQPQLPLCVLFVVQEAERNVFDQRHIEYALQDLGVAAFRLPFAETMAHTSIPNENSSRPLVYRPPHAPSTPYEVTTLYFRATYTPNDFPGADAWHARYQLERSAAIKCPSILTHLAGTKKVQQVLATPSSPYLSRFLPDEAAAARVRNTFAAMYPLDDSEAGKHAKQLALSDASNGYVLKPQREGGGNNIYRKDIPEFLRQLGSEERWRGHVLMELIEPPSQQNSLFRDGEVQTGEVIAEFGVYGTCLWRRSGEMVSNKEAGYLLRTKGRESSEGGVAAGFGTVDSACLVDV